VLGGLSGRPLVALGLGVLFGTVRGAAVLLGRHLDTPEALRRFHARFSALGPRSRVAVVVVELVVALLLVATVATAPTADSGQADTAVLAVLATLAAAVLVAVLATGRTARFTSSGRPGPTGSPTGSAVASRAGLAGPGEARLEGAPARPSVAPPRP
jgi:cytochrome bd-type quinol oxidase subunit 2